MPRHDPARGHETRKLLTPLLPNIIGMTSSGLFDPRVAIFALRWSLDIDLFPVALSISAEAEMVQCRLLRNHKDKSDSIRMSRGDAKTLLKKDLRYRRKLASFSCKILSRLDYALGRDA
jgi:hypothetical protein